MFVKHAQGLAEWDKYILKNRHSLLSLEGDLGRVVKGTSPPKRVLQGAP